MSPGPLLLLSNQFLFMLGFYMVVPFLAIFMREDLGMESVAIGLVLGLRTFSQQGLFIVGGAFADRLGARRLILLGCTVRIAGFVVLAFSTNFTSVLIGACLTGLAGALFSPAISSLAAVVGTADARGQARARFFARLAVWGEVGAIGGPLLGALLLGIGFQAMALGGAVVFALAYLVLYLRLPHDTPALGTAHGAWWRVFEDRLFVAFTLAHSAFLFCYNQLYFALPVELARAGGTDADLAPLFMIASLMVVAFQVPVTRLAMRASWSKSLGIGFAVMACAFLFVAVFATQQPFEGHLRLLPAVGLVVLLIMGQMIVRPIAMDLVPQFAGERPTGVYFGALASAGGLAVLVGNLALAPVLELGLVSGHPASIPWLALATVPAVGALAIVPIIRLARHRLKT